MKITTPGWALAGVLLVGCTTEAVQAPSQPTAQQKRQPAADNIIIVAQPGLTAQERFREALRMLEDGQPRQARAELVAYIEQKPRSDVARDLLRQVDEDPEVYFPSDYREITLASGESLSTLAQQYLGSVYQFYALAKYNGIAQPRRLRAGQSLKIPLTETARASFAMDDDPASLAREVAAEAESRVAAPGRPGSVAEAGGEAAGTDQAAASAVAQESPAAAAETVEEPLPQPALEPTVVSAASAAESKELHRRALNAFRAQDLDRAITLWDQVLALDPEHENARLYRAQALELQSKLRRLN